jgi:hypothetical protein
LPDAYGNKMADEMVRDQEAVAAAQSDPLIESTLEALLWAKNPEARAEFKEITKDVSMANLSPQELEEAREVAELAFECRHIGLSSDAEFFRFKNFFLCDSSQAKGGFSHRQLGEQGKTITFQGNVPGGQAQSKQTPWWQFWKMPFGGGGSGR